MSPGRNNNPILIADLDGIFLNANMLFEAMCNSISRNWPSMFGVPSALAAGKEKPKGLLVEQSELDARLLPHNGEVLNTPGILWGICPVLLFRICRMITVTQREKMHDDPLVFTVADRVSQVCFFLVVIFVAGGATI